MAAKPITNSIMSRFAKNPLKFMMNIIDTLAFDGATKMLLSLAIVGLQIWCGVHFEWKAPDGWVENLCPIYILLHVVAGSLAYELLMEAMVSFGQAEILREMAPIIPHDVAAMKELFA